MAWRKKPKVEKVDFVIAGAQKAGTTALHYFLEQHPAVLLPVQQELHFFDDDDWFAGGANYERLHASFPASRRAQIVGECTPNYLYWPPAMERIANYNRQMKIVISLRNPITRAFSQWNMQRERGFEGLDFLEAIAAENERHESLPALEARRFAYVGRGHYARQLERVFQFFSREQVKIVEYEDFRKNQLETMNSIFGFLGVEALEKLPGKEINVIPYERKITMEDKLSASELFREEIVRLEKLLGWDCSDWKM